MKDKKRKAVMKKINNSNRPLGESFLSLKKTCLLSKWDKTPIYVSYPFYFFFSDLGFESTMLKLTRFVSSATYLFKKDMTCAPRNACYTCGTLPFHFHTILNTHCVSLAVMGHTGNVHSTKSSRHCYKKKIHIMLG